MSIVEQAKAELDQGGGRVMRWFLSLFRRRKPTPAELWEIHHRPIWG